MILILAANVAALAQNGFAGLYRAAIFDQNFKVVSLEVTVKPDASATATVMLPSDNDLRQIVDNLIGKVDQKGKIKIESVLPDGSTIKITGNLPKSAAEKDAKALFARKTKIKTRESVSVSEITIEGNWAKIEKPIVKPPVSDEKDVLVDTGKTHLYFTESVILHSGEWLNAVFTSKDETTDNGKNPVRVLYAVENDTANQPMRNLRIRLSLKPDAKSWTATDKTIEAALYRENKGESRAMYFYQQMGEIEIVADTQSEIVYRIKKLRLKKVGADQFLTINGFLHVAK